MDSGPLEQFQDRSLGENETVVFSPTAVNTIFSGVKR